MTHELIYTSAQRGLHAGTQGFCIVAETRGLPALLRDKLEDLSGYRPLFGPHDANAARNPVLYSHLRLTVQGKTYSVLSRVCAAGVDHTQRSNKFAHHVVLEGAERPPGGPPWLLAQRGFMETAWDGKVGAIPAGRKPPGGDTAAAPCRAWQEATGDAGWAGALIESFENDPNRPVYLLYPLEVDPLRLLAEALALMPAESRWQVTFSTYFTTLQPGVACTWRCVPLEAPEAREASRTPGALVLKLERSLGRAEGGPLAEAARTGKGVAAFSPRQTPTAASTSGSHVPAVAAAHTRPVVNPAPVAMPRTGERHGVSVPVSPAPPPEANGADEKTSPAPEPIPVPFAGAPAVRRGGGGLLILGLLLGILMTGGVAAGALWLRGDLRAVLAGPKSVEKNGSANPSPEPDLVAWKTQAEKDRTEITNLKNRVKDLEGDLEKIDKALGARLTDRSKRSQVIGQLLKPDSESRAELDLVKGELEKLVPGDKKSLVEKIRQLQGSIDGKAAEINKLTARLKEVQQPQPSKVLTTVIDQKAAVNKWLKEELLRGARVGKDGWLAGVPGLLESETRYPKELSDLDLPGGYHWLLVMAIAKSESPRNKTAQYAADVRKKCTAILASSLNPVVLHKAFEYLWDADLADALNEYRNPDNENRAKSRMEIRAICEKMRDANWSAEQKKRAEDLLYEFRPRKK